MIAERARAVECRYEIFIKRLELSDDPAAKEYLRYTNAQMLNGGFTMQAMFTGLKQSLQQYETWTQQEERAAADPQAHQRFKQVRSGLGFDCSG